MAQVFNNVLTSGLRGRIGKQLVFRVVNGVTIVSHAATKPDRTKETEAQRKTRTTFRAATHWAKAQLTIPERRDYYIRLARKWNLTNAYTAAIKDYMCHAGRMREGGKSVSIIDQTRKKTASVNERSLRTARMAISYDTPTRHTDISVARFLNLACPDFPLDESRLPLDLGDRTYNRHLRAPTITTSLLSPKLIVRCRRKRTGLKSLHPT